MKIYRYLSVPEASKYGSPLCRGPDDLRILGLSEVAKPDYITTGDRDLLSLKEFHSTPIITPREFWERSKSPRR